MGAKGQPNSNPNCNEAMAKGRETRRRNRELGVLTGRRLKFAQLMVDPSMAPAAAAVQAGYKPTAVGRTAWRLLNDPIVKMWLESRREVVAARNDVSEDEVILSLRRLRDQAEKDCSWSAAIRATELLGRYMKMFGTKIDITSRETPSSVFISSAEGDDREHQVDRLTMIGQTKVIKLNQPDEEQIRQPSNLEEDSA